MYGFLFVLLAIAMVFAVERSIANCKMNNAK
jgi:hypothetical protein